MKIKSLVLASILTIPSFSVINIPSVLAQIQRPIGRSYALPASPTTSSIALEDSDGDSIVDIQLINRPSPRLEFDILTELDGQLITDRDSDPTTGFFPDAVSSFLYAVDEEETLTSLENENGNLLPSTQEQEIIERVIRDPTPTTFDDGDLLAELFVPGAIPTTFADGNLLETNIPSVFDSGIVYSFLFEEEFISFLLPLDENPDIETVLAVNDLSYILDQNLLGREPIFSGASFNTNIASLSSGQPTIISSSQSIPESNNLISLLGLGLLGIGSLIRERVKKF